MPHLDVRASVPSGLVVDGRFPIPFDGLLGSVWFRRRDGRKQFEPRLLDKIEEAPLSVAEVTIEGHQVPVASAARLFTRGAEQVIANVVDTLYFHSRQSSRAIYRRSEFEGVVDPARRNFAAARRPFQRAVVDEARWEVVADLAEVEDLVEDVTALGGRRGSGNGPVAEWSVTEVDDPRDGWALWDGARPLRPIPVGDDWDGPTGVHALRAPYWHDAVHVVAL